MAKPSTPAVASMPFAVAERVSHFMYGPGTIAEIGHTYTVIDFDENGRRKFVTTMVQLESTTILAPIPIKKAKARAKATKAVKAVKAAKAVSAASATKAVKAVKAVSAAKAAK